MKKLLPLVALCLMLLSLFALSSCDFLYDIGAMEKTSEQVQKEKEETLKTANTLVQNAFTYAGEHACKVTVKEETTCKDAKTKALLEEMGISMTANANAYTFIYDPSGTKYQEMFGNDTNLILVDNILYNREQKVLLTNEELEILRPLLSLNTPNTTSFMSLGFCKELASLFEDVAIEMEGGKRTITYSKLSRAGELLFFSGYAYELIPNYANSCIADTTLTFVLSGNKMERVELSFECAALGEETLYYTRTHSADFKNADLQEIQAPSDADTYTEISFEDYLEQKSMSVEGLKAVGSNEFKRTAELIVSGFRNIADQAYTATLSISQNVGAYGSSTRENSATYDPTGEKAYVDFLYYDDRVNAKRGTIVKTGDAYYCTLGEKKYKIASDENSVFINGLVLGSTSAQCLYSSIFDFELFGYQGLKFEEVKTENGTTSVCATINEFHDTKYECEYVFDDTEFTVGIIQSAVVNTPGGTAEQYTVNITLSYQSSDLSEIELPEDMQNYESISAKEFLDIINGQ